MRSPRPSSVVAVGLCGALWVGGGAAVADAVTSSPAHAAAPAAAPARTVAYDVELVVTPQTRYVNTPLTVDGHKTFFAPPNKVTRWKITFGDKASKSGTSVKVPKLTHTYKKTGHYTAKLEVTDAHGARQSVSYGFSVIKKPVKKASPAPSTDTASPSPTEGVKVSPIAAPSSTVTTSPTPSPTPPASIDPDSPSPGSVPSPSPSPSPSPAATSSSPGCTLGLGGLCVARTTPTGPAGSSGGDLAALGLVGLAILSTPLAVATVRRRRS
jgi:hypothetical protein